MFSVDQCKDRDETKLRKCKENSITLIVIPHWWNGSKEELVGTILKERSDLRSMMMIPEGLDLTKTIPLFQPDPHAVMSTLKVNAVAPLRRRQLRKCMSQNMLRSGDTQV